MSKVCLYLFIFLIVGPHDLLFFLSIFFKQQHIMYVGSI